MSQRLWASAGGLGAIAAVLAVVLVAAVWVQSRQLALVDRAVRSSQDYSVLSIYQVEIEYLRLRDQWQRALAESPPDLNVLQLRYDVWVSRLGLARSQSLQTLLGNGDGYAGTLDSLDRFVAEADRWFGAKRVEDPDARVLTDLARKLDALEQIDGQTVMPCPAEGFYATEGLGVDEIRLAYILNKDI